MQDFGEGQPGQEEGRSPVSWGWAAAPWALGWGKGMGGQRHSFWAHRRWGQGGGRGWLLHGPGRGNLG